MHEGEGFRPNWLNFLHFSRPQMHIQISPSVTWLAEHLLHQLFFLSLSFGEVQTRTFCPSHDLSILTSKKK